MAISFLPMNLGFKNDFEVESGILNFLNCLGLVINIFICEERPFVFDPNPTKVGAIRGLP